MTGPLGVKVTLEVGVNDQVDRLRLSPCSGNVYLKHNKWEADFVVTNGKWILLIRYVQMAVPLGLKVRGWGYCSS